MLILRDMRESDIEDYVRWFTTETEWGSWDAPWEPLGMDEEEERKSWIQIFLYADMVRESCYGKSC